MRFPKRLLSIAAALTALSSVASGYYHFVYFPSRTGPFNPINLQFDLSKLTNNTVYFFISDQGPDVFVPGDSFTGVISELQLAAQAWNNIPTSQIKIAFGGMENAATQQSAPGIDVIFSDDNIAPGILAQTKVTTYANVSFINSFTPSLPILRSQIQLRKDLTVTSPQQASFYDSSFTTMTHEFGHALGLQHTLTSGCMSTYVTRSTTKSMPIAADDVAGVSLLYPTQNYLSSVGSINGRVTLNGSGVNLASVVAISPVTGVAISNLTNPDGTYRIDGIPPGPANNYYLVYVHPLPPAQQGEAGPDAIVLPQDASQISFPAYTGFATQFAGGGRDWTQATQFFINPVIPQTANFNVQASAGPAVSGFELYGYLNGTILEASPMLPANASYNLLFCSPGITNGSSLAPGLNVSVIGSAAPAEIIPNYTRFYGSYVGCGYPYVFSGTWTFPVQSTTPVAVAVTVNNDLYVLPAAFFVVPSGPPSISSLGSPATDAFGNSTVTVFGSSLTSSTQIVFDGAPANLISANGDGSLTVQVPPAPGPYNSSVEALNPDGQTSGQALQPPPGLTAGPAQTLYSYNYANPATIALSAATLSPGTDAVITITGNNTNFNAQTTVGFGTSDIVVRPNQVFVTSPTTLLVNASVSPNAPLLTTANVTVTTGLQTATSSPDLGTGQGLQIVAASPNQITLHAPIANSVTGLAGVSSLGSVILNVTPTPVSLAGWTFSIGGQLANLSYVAGQLEAAIPSGLAIGSQIATLTSPAGATASLAMTINPQPPLLQSVVNAAGVTITNTTIAVHPGDTLTLNLIMNGNSMMSSNSFASVGGITGGFNAQSAVSVPVLPNSSISPIQIQLPYSVPTGTAVPLYVGTGTNVSAPFYLNIHN